MKGVIIFSLLFTQHCFSFHLSPDTISEHRKLDAARLGIVICGSAAVVAAAHLQNYNSWWEGERAAFHFGDSDELTLGADKAGHFYFSYITSDVFARSLSWSGIEKSRAYAFSAALSIAFQLYVETEDGFTKKLGFSAGDVLADLGGALYPLLQYNYPSFNEIRFKWSCYPSGRYQRGDFRTIVDDYESMRFWISFGNKLLPGRLFSVLPEFLCFSVGFGVRALNSVGGGSRELFISLDYDFTKLPGEGSFLSAMKYVLNYIHFPAPTVRLTPEVTLYGFHF